MYHTKSTLMKRIVTIAVLLALSLSGFAQKLDYDKDSKWFIGFNAGGTWNTTDVKNKTNMGWGFTLGRAFNYNYGKKFSFDLRLRYLGGNWYGQDYDTTDVNGNTFYPDNSPVVSTYDSIGYTYNNFNTEAHELGLELVLHANSLRERTGWDPYIFGGVGVVWNSSYGDLIIREADSLGNGTSQAYDYSPDGMTKTQWNELSDDAYETTFFEKRVSIVPHLGIGLAYQVGPKFSIGVEHRTMFYLQNDFDGYLGNSSKWGMKNDLYHYSGLTFKFHLGRKSSTVVDDNINTNTNTNNLTNTGGCDGPTVNFTNPRTGSTTVSQQDFTFEATIKNVSGKENIQFFVNGNQTSNFNYNPSTGRFTAYLPLNDGINAVRLRAANGCGDDEQQVTIRYINCVPPTLRITSPTATIVNTDRTNIAITAQVQNASNVHLYVNGVSSNDYVLNGSVFNANVNLLRGTNTIRITAGNECGTQEETITVNAGDCKTPVVKIMSGTGTVNVSSEFYNFKSQVQNVASSSEVNLLVNGTGMDFSWTQNSTTLTRTIKLSPGRNTIVVSGTNDCGTNSSNVVVVYTPCQPPKISMINPTAVNSTINANTVEVKANIVGISSANQVRVLVNGVERFGGTINTGVFTQMISLNEGPNTVVIKAKNDCGETEKSITINRKRCVGPQITMISPAAQNSTVTTNTFSFSANILGVQNAGQVKLSVNGTNITRGNYNSATGVYSASFNLQEGSNTIVLTATNECATTELDYTIIFDNCKAPTVQILEPLSGANLTSTSTTLKVKLTNIINTGQIFANLNGNPITNGSYNVSTGIYSASVTLQEGNNLISIRAENDCGKDEKNTNVTVKGCDKPRIVLTDPSQSTVLTQTGNILVKAKVYNVTDRSQITVKMGGAVQNGGTFNASNGEFQINLSAPQGVSSVIISVSNGCGVVSKSFAIRHEPCTPPTVSILSPTSTTTTNSTVLLQASVQNISSVSQLTLKVNGATLTGGNYNATTGLFERVIDVNIGANTINLTAVTDCGRDSKGITIRRNEEQKITICHYPPGNTENPQQIEIPLSAWPAHQAHGDVLGPCPTSSSSSDPGTGIGIGIGGTGGGGTVVGGSTGGDNNSGDGNKEKGDDKEKEEENDKSPIDLKPKTGNTRPGRD